MIISADTVFQNFVERLRDTNTVVGTFMAPKDGRVTCVSLSARVGWVIPKALPEICKVKPCNAEVLNSSIKVMTDLEVGEYTEGIWIYNPEEQLRLFPRSREKAEDCLERFDTDVNTFFTTEKVQTKMFPLDDLFVLSIHSKDNKRLIIPNISLRDSWNVGGFHAIGYLQGLWPELGITAKWVDGESLFRWNIEPKSPCTFLQIDRKMGENSFTIKPCG